MTLPIPADSAQQTLLQAIWEAFSTGHQWPTFGQIDRRLDQTHQLDAQALLMAISPDLVQGAGSSITVPDDRELKLTIAGVAACDTNEAPMYVQLFLDSLRLAAEFEVSSPTHFPDLAELTSKDARVRLALPAAGQDDVLWRLGLLLTVDNWGWTSNNLNPSVKSWSFGLNRRVRSYRGVRDVGDYWTHRERELAPALSGNYSLQEAVMTESTQPPTVFLVHGHDLLKHQVARVIDQLTGNDPIILDEQASRGRTLLEKFEEHAAGAAVAVVLLTPDDVGGATGAALQPRARQNVVFELGHFCGRLGRQNVIVLNAGVEQPSDIAGLVYIPMPGDGWTLKLGRELDAAGVPVDLNRLR